MTNQRNAPLVYTIVMVKYPRIPDVERFINGFHDKIRHEYPLCNEFKASILNADISPQGVSLTQHESRIWQFSSVDQKWAFILSDQSFCLHTIDYQNFSHFIERFESGIKTLLDVPKIGVEWFAMLGLRYINLVTPQANKKLSDYLNAWVLPLEPLKDSLKVLEGAHVNRFKTKAGELRLQVLRNPQLTLPPELHSPLVVKNGWVRNRPDREFALVDIDHSLTFSPPEKIDIQKTLKGISDLHKTVRDVFDSIGTHLAYKEWGFK